MNSKIENGIVLAATTNLKVGDKVKLITATGSEIVNITSITTTGFAIKETLNNQSIFIYGTEVDDFRSVDYEALSTLNISATQELLKRLNSQSDLIQQLQAQQNATQVSVLNLQQALDQLLHRQADLSVKAEK
jgi:hypothetical protein